MSEHKSFVLSDWTPVEDGCWMRYLRHTDPNDIRNRVAFIEKTPRIRVAAYSEDRKIMDSINWMGGFRSFKGDPSSRVWCDDQLFIHGWDIYGQFDLPVMTDHVYYRLIQSIGFPRVDFSRDVIPTMQRDKLPTWNELLEALAKETPYSDNDIFVIFTWSGAIRHYGLCQVVEGRPVFWFQGRNSAWLVRIDSEGTKDFGDDDDTRFFMTRELLRMQHHGSTYLHPDIDMQRVQRYRTVVAGIGKASADLNAFLQQAK